MKKIFPLLVLVLIAGLAVYFLFMKKGNSPAQTAASNTRPSQSTSATNSGSTATTAASAAGQPGSTGATKPHSPKDPEEDGADDAAMDKQDKPAAELYKTSEEALAAIKQAALTYDDLVLEQFTQPGEDCSWCESFYSSIKDMVTSPEVNQEQRNYFAEVLAVSGRVDNIKTLVEAIKNSPSQEVAEAMAEALELTVGKNDVVNYLGEQLASENETLRESSVAAITNQGSRLAVDLLYKNTVDKGDPDGFYSLGIGLGELVPEEEAFPKLQEIMQKRDQYSHLAVKSLLNSGAEGLKLVLDSLASSKTLDFDKEMLKGAVDHISWDDETTAVIDKTIGSSTNQAVLDFVKQVKEELKPDANKNTAPGDSAPSSGAVAAPQ